MPHLGSFIHFSNVSSGGKKIVKSPLFGYFGCRFLSVLKENISVKSYGFQYFEQKKAEKFGFLINNIKSFDHSIKFCPHVFDVDLFQIFSRKV